MPTSIIPTLSEFSVSPAVANDLLASRSASRADSSCLIASVFSRVSMFYNFLKFGVARKGGRGVSENDFLEITLFGVFTANPSLWFFNAICRT